MVTKTPTKAKAPAKSKTAVKKAVAHKAPAEADQEKAVAKQAPKHTIAAGRYIFATGRRKTAVSNVRLFEGKGDFVVNKKPLKQYFNYSYHQDLISKPLEVTGLMGKYYFTTHINGGGQNSQAEALRHGIAVALSKISEDVRKVLKKNGFLTRDDRKKERKKPGLKRARRSPQWAKR